MAKLMTALLGVMLVCVWVQTAEADIADIIKEALEKIKALKDKKEDLKDKKEEPPKPEEPPKEEPPKEEKPKDKYCSKDYKGYGGYQYHG
ncbi:uncharacterized protein [Periplaneta americana]|uniref:uncharacterized protein isoform X2 n=1 Tax=Periplaneta americana TaxID=6978 RepID=UPI0037E743B7